MVNPPLDSAAVSSILMIKGSIEGHVTDILVDTGVVAM